MPIEYHNVVVLEAPYGLTAEEVQLANDAASKLSCRLYDRQKEFFAENYSEAIMARTEKIRVGIIAEIALKRVLDSMAKTEIVYGGLLSNTNGADKYDLLIGKKTFDVKSSVERSQAIIGIKNPAEVAKAILANRNFTLPEDQPVKDFVFQIVYVAERAYLCGGIETKELVRPENLRELKLNNGQVQKTYMKKLMFGQPLHNLLKHCRSERDSDRKHSDIILGRK